MKTFMASPATIDRKWYVVDAEAVNPLRVNLSVTRLPDSTPK